MVYFSFAIRKNFLSNNIKKQAFNLQDILPYKKYYCKNTKIWKILNLKSLQSDVIFLKKEKILKIKKLKNNILFCPPPNIGLGDAIEYALSIKSILMSQKFKRVGIAFIGRYKIVFEKRTGAFKNRTSRKAKTIFKTIKIRKTN